MDTDNTREATTMATGFLTDVVILSIPRGRRYTRENYWQHQRRMKVKMYVEMAVGGIDEDDSEVG